MSSTMGNHYAAAEAHPDAIYLTSPSVDTVEPEPDMETARLHARKILADNPADAWVEIYNAAGVSLEIIVR